MKLEDLSKEQRAGLLAELQLDEKKKEELKQSERKIYKELAGKLVDEVLLKLQNMSSELTTLKIGVFKHFESLVAMKTELYEVKSKQQSHTFTNAAGNSRITIGYRVLDRFDDTANEGIAIVREYMDSLATDEQTANLVQIVNNLLKRDKQGNLKVNRVVELQNIAKELNAEKLKEGVKIILDAFKPERSAYFVDADVKNGAGAWQTVPLSITAAVFPKDFEVKF